jgi:hypothetical protein
MTFTVIILRCYFKGEIHPDPDEVERPPTAAVKYKEKAPPADTSLNHNQEGMIHHHTRKAAHLGCE